MTTKADLGACSNGTDHVFGYTAGYASGRRVLLCAGIHGEETLGQQCAMRWFQEFALGTDKVMAYLRGRVKVTWIPTLNPNGYRSERINANDVDCNRNFDYEWAAYEPENADHAKGAAAFSEPESQIVQALAATMDAVIACHNFGDTPYEMQIVMPSVNAAGGAAAQAIANAARTRWLANYGTPAGYGMTIQRLNEDIPTETNWFTDYATGVGDRFNPAAICVEAPANLAGSVHGEARHRTTQEAMRLYCGFITYWMLEWLLTP